MVFPSENRTAPSKGKVILPGQTIGILGGGQLGRMIALSAREMGYRVAVLDPQPDSPCGQTADWQIISAFDDVDKALTLAAKSDVVTYEFENVEANVVRVLEQRGHLHEGSGRLLYTTQHRIREKTALQERGIPVAPFRPVQTREALFQAVDNLGVPCVLKTAEGGYDGKGQRIIRERSEIERAFEDLGAGRVELILESFVPFVKELSVIAARRSTGEIKVFPVAENIHRNNILHQSIVPARVSDSIKEEAIGIATKIADLFGVIGLIAVEMFLIPDGSLFVNELAPRPHNSGHYTQDACVTSQFEQHVRAICNLPLAVTELRTPVVMVNILGEHLQALMKDLPSMKPNVKVHLYGKKESRPGRKMGHVNIVAPSTEEALAIADDLHIW